MNFYFRYYIIFIFLVLGILGNNTLHTQPNSYYLDHCSTGCLPKNLRPLNLVRLDSSSTYLVMVYDRGHIYQFTIDIDLGFAGKKMLWNSNTELEFYGLPQVEFGTREVGITSYFITDNHGLQGQSGAIKYELIGVDTSGLKVRKSLQWPGFTGIPKGIYKRNDTIGIVVTDSATNSNIRLYELLSDSLQLVQSFHSFDVKSVSLIGFRTDSILVFHGKINSDRSFISTLSKGEIKILDSLEQAYAVRSYQNQFGNYFSVLCRTSAMDSMKLIKVPATGICETRNLPIGTSLASIPDYWFTPIQGSGFFISCTFPRYDVQLRTALFHFTAWGELVASRDLSMSLDQGGSMSLPNIYAAMHSDNGTYLTAQGGRFITVSPPKVPRSILEGASASLGVDGIGQYFTHWHTTGSRTIGKYSGIGVINNPCTSSMLFRNSSNAYMKVRVFDGSGAQVLVADVSPGVQSVSVGNLGAGVYYVQYKNQKGYRVSEKVIVTD